MQFHAIIIAFLLPSDGFNRTTSILTLLQVFNGFKTGLCGPDSCTSVILQAIHYFREGHERYNPILALTLSTEKHLAVKSLYI